MSQDAPRTGGLAARSIPFQPWKFTFRMRDHHVAQQLIKKKTKQDNENIYSQKAAVFNSAADRKLFTNVAPSRTRSRAVPSVNSRILSFIPDLPTGLFPWRGHFLFKMESYSKKEKQKNEANSRNEKKLQVGRGKKKIGWKNTIDCHGFFRAVFNRNVIVSGWSLRMCSSSSKYPPRQLEKWNWRQR